MSAAASLWLGPVHTEARSAFQRARDAGLSPLRALVIGTIASFRDCWAFRSKIAEHIGCSTRTVQRAITQAKSEGLIGVARAKQDEKPPNWHSVVPCGWSHRWTIGWGKAGPAAEQAVQAARARWIVRMSVEAMKPAPAPAEASSAAPRPAARPVRPEIQRRRWTAAELEAELERLERQKQPPPPD